MTNEDAMTIMMTAWNRLSSGGSISGSQYEAAIDCAIRALCKPAPPDPAPDSKGYVIEACVYAHAVGKMSKEDVVVRVFTGDEWRASHPAEPSGAKE